MSSDQSSLSDHGQGGQIERDRPTLPLTAPTDPIIRSVPEAMRDPDPPTLVARRDYLIPVTVESHDAVCDTCNRYVTVTPQGVELGHYRAKSDETHTCPHRGAGL